MKIKLKLDRDELKGLIAILQIISSRKVTQEELTQHLYEAEIKKMTVNYIARLMSTTQKFTIALTGFQVFILFSFLSYFAVGMAPFERALSLIIIAKIDQQWLAHKQMMFNFMSENKQNSNLSLAEMQQKQLTN